MNIRTHALQLDAPIVTGNTKAAAAAAGATSADLWMTPYESLRYDPRDNVRPVDQQWVKDLASLMIQNGYDKGSPLHCYARKVDGKDYFYVYKGQHRYLAAGAAIKAGKDLGKIPIVVRDARDVKRSEMVIDGYVSNVSKASSPLDLATSIAELRDVHGMDSKAICARLNISEQSIRDAALLEKAPAELHALVRDGSIAGTLAIEEIRTHGADKALERIVSGLSKAKEAGKSKVTKKHLSAARANSKTKGITAPQAKSLLCALQAVLHDVNFGKLLEPTRNVVHDVLMPLADLLDAKPATRKTPSTAAEPRAWEVSPMNEHGVFEEVDTWTLPSGNVKVSDPLASIELAQIEQNAWIYAIAYSHSQGGSSGPLKLFSTTRIFRTHDQALQHSARSLIDTFANGHASSKHIRSVADKIIRWAERITPKNDADLTPELRELPAAFSPKEASDLRARLGLDATGCPLASWQEAAK
ncbi:MULTISPECIES: pyridoxal phosphate biosynthetic protein PdxJ [unclassified Burkholderia]|uniref:pyridoxal phosphate biosynthetic protein PdxJ n=1 Tax=unclassified Burkholderia TaxID=2613784 RepID=UPI0021AB30F2|nr:MULTISPECIES: pyridoxal phosphate biosynthetic protein PdxJ [unclassified Burkholderia]